MVDRDLLHDRILEEATREFATKGVKAVRMDDIARRLGISKRTLYETFSNKEDLLLECVSRREAERESYMADFYADPRHNAIEVALEHYKHMMKAASSINANYLVEIAHYKKVVAYFEKNRKDNEEKAVMFMRRGVAEGFFRADVDYEIMMHVADGIMESMIQKRLYDMWSIGQLFRNVFFLFFRGICTPEGLKLIDTLVTDIPSPTENSDN